VSTVQCIIHIILCTLVASSTTKHAGICISITETYGMQLDLALA